MFLSLFLQDSLEHLAPGPQKWMMEVQYHGLNFCGEFDSLVSSYGHVSL